MDLVYYNDDMPSTTSDHTQYRGNCIQNQEVTTPKWTKVLLIVQSISLIIALGGLCVLGIMSQTSNSKTNMTVCHGKLYYFSSDIMNWSSSRAFCVSKGADLVTITSQSEHDFLASEIKVQHWIGLNDLKTEGHWVWVNNQSLSETGLQLWHKRASGLSEPDNWRVMDPSGENCAVVGYFGGHVDWFDISCKLERNFIFNPIQLQERESGVISPKWTKVLLIVLGFALVFALGGLCTLGILYNNKLADFESLNNQHIMVSKQLSAQKINSTIMKKEFKDLTARYNTLREWLSFYDAQTCNLSVDGWIACRGKLYLFNSDKLNWSSSQDVCISKGADLVTITNQTEQNYLVSKIKEAHWIGLNDLETEGHWVWVNNQTLTETGVQFWFMDSPRQPDNWRNQDPSGENCASLGDENGNFQSWFDASCKKTRKFICEKKY
ncbi:hypothetical protein QQF64_013206 [Cirrhinus molitorella]|uniref:C-type lectin domain-containing protein n=1 Tax=Cirrhinus molitorella TaxID=172907 RepID=A0ABR3LS45_9TELE